MKSQTSKPAKKRLNMQKKRSLYGLLYILPWLIGAIYFFVVPLIQATIYAFCKVTLTATGEEFKPIGFSNFIYLFTQDPNFITNLANSILNVIYQIPVIIVFSFIIAVQLREKFFGRTLARAIFFFPFIIASGVVITILKEQVLMMSDNTAEQQSYMFAAPSFTYFIEQMNVPKSIVELVQNVLNGFFDILWKSGLQIILLLAAVNHIPSSSYEAAEIEGASGWEKLWLITFPMISPTILVVLIYSIIDSFTDYGNKIMRMVSSYFSLGQYEYSATIGIVYFIIVLLLVGVVNYVVGRRIHYAVE